MNTASARIRRMARTAMGPNRASAQARYSPPVINNRMPGFSSSSRATG